MSQFQDCCDISSLFDLSKVETFRYNTINDIIDIADIYLHCASVMMFICPILWIKLCRTENEHRTLSKFVGSSCGAFAYFVFLTSILASVRHYLLVVRVWDFSKFTSKLSFSYSRFIRLIISQPAQPVLCNNATLWIGHLLSLYGALVCIRIVFITPGGLTSAFFGHYFGMPVESHCYTADQLYLGTFLVYFGLSIANGLPVAFVFSLAFGSWMYIINIMERTYHGEMYSCGLQVVDSDGEVDTGCTLDGCEGGSPCTAEDCAGGEGNVAGGGGTARDFCNVEGCTGEDGVCTGGAAAEAYSQFSVDSRYRDNGDAGPFDSGGVAADIRCSPYDSPEGSVDVSLARSIDLGFEFSESEDIA